MDAATSLGELIDEANAAAHARILASEPVLTDVVVAGDAIPELNDRLILHAGPPISWDRMCGPMRGAACGAMVFEGWAETIAEAEEQAADGKVRFEPNHHYDAVGPMTGITTRSMPLFAVDNRALGHRAYCTINEGMGNVMRFGGNNAEVVKRLGWMAAEVGPTLGAALRQCGGIPLKSLIARGLTMGDEMHMRNAACTGLFLRELAPVLVETAESLEVLQRVLRFLSENDMFFLNIVMPMAKSMIMAAQDIEHCTVVTTMARNGTDFGIRLSATGDQWFTAPAETAEGLLFPGFEDADANPDIGDSCIVETVGLGGFSMAASPAVVGFVGAGSLENAIGYTRSMMEIIIGPNPEWPLLTLASVGAPTGIDARHVVATGISPVINTAIAHREAGRGQIGAGIVRAPMECFQQAITAFACLHSVEA